MKRVYVCSRLSAPTKAEVQRNVVRARQLCYLAMSEHDDVAPFAPHGFYTEFLDDSDPEDREAGRHCGMVYLHCADEVWIFSRDGVSGGMQEEIEAAQTFDIPVVWDPACWEAVDA